ncbi:hypothetical protein [Chelativorans sp. YIM 93263]|uniref:hypothetical protein n=1 Tax=Chelativorans sp. YIM 93263 TaxID=2906648 RepID=UPI002378A215|nr:hypothetical protein [Chelativorans sp. YIM 93263]
MDTVAEFTQSARDHAARTGILERLRTFSPDARIVTGDLIEFAGDGGTETFVVYARRLRVRPDGRQTLAFVLDYPPRHPRP